MNEFYQNLFDFLALVVGFMILLLVCAVISKVIYLRGLRRRAERGLPDETTVVPNYVITSGADAMKRASKLISMQRTIILDMVTQAKRGHLIFDCTCNDCTRLAIALRLMKDKESEK